MNDQTKLQLIGRAEELDFPELNIRAVPARIDTGAKTSALWASDIHEIDGELHYVLFGIGSPHHSNTALTTRDYRRRLVSTSTGQVEERYVVRHLVQLSGRKVRASFTLADRSSQAYPALVGRNILRGKFLVDVKQGKPRLQLERAKEKYKHIIHSTNVSNSVKKRK